MESSLKENKVLCILGMHRSGTSLTANWLSACGLNLGDNLIDGDYSNQKGHFEDKDFLQLHKDILISNKLDGSGLFLPKDHLLSISDYHKKKIDHLLHFKNDLHHQWGWKEPRTCLFIEEYLKLLPELKVLIIHRPIIESIQSLLKRDFNRWKKELSHQSSLRRIVKNRLKERFRKRINQTNTFQYMHSSEVYLDQIIKSIKLNRKNTLVITLDQLLHRNNDVFHLLQEQWDFNLAYQNIDSIYEESLIGKELDLSLIDIPESLLEKDTYIQNHTSIQC